MATKTCSSCGGSGYNSLRGVTPGSQKDKSICTGCGGKGWVYDYSSGSGYSSGGNSGNSSTGGGGYSTGGNGGCFTGDSKVKTPDGWKNIKDLTVDDLVVSIDKNGCLVNRKILKVKILHNRKVLSLLTSNNVISVTPGHSIQLSNKKWKRVNQLKHGDKISYLDNHELIKDHSILAVRNKRSETVYNLVVEGDFNFVVDGCIAHCFSYFKSIKKLYYTIRFNDQKVFQHDLRLS